MSKSRKSKKSSCGCKKSLRLWGGGKRRRSNRRNKKSRKTVRGGFVIEQTYPFPGVSCVNTIPLNGEIGGSGDLSSPVNVVNAQQTNPPINQPINPPH